MILDNFQSGPHNVTLTAGLDDAFQPGSMVGGQRNTRLLVSSALGHPATLSVGAPSGLVLSTGVDAFHRLEVWYGSIGDPQETLGLDLDGVKSLRTTFSSNDAVLNFNVAIFDELGGWVVHGTNPGAVTDVDLPLDDFTGLGVDLTKITFIGLIIQTAAVRAGNDYAISSFEAL